MGKSRYKMTEEKIQKWIAEGRGQGRKSKYKPWLNVQDVPSLGTLPRGQVEILDVREQYGLSLGNSESDLDTADDDTDDDE